MCKIVSSEKSRYSTHSVAWCPVTTQRGGGGGRFKREGVYVYIWLIHVAVWQKPQQHCKTITLQLKINGKKKRIHDKYTKEERH